MLGSQFSLRYETNFNGGSSVFLSRVGRLSFIKSVLNSLPIYYMNMFKMPKAIVKKIISLQRNFFWVGVSGEKKSMVMIK